MAESFLFAARYLMRMPTVPQAAVPLPSGVSTWFPAVGMVMGLMVGVVVRVSSTVDVWFAALAGLLTWVALTRARSLAGFAGIAFASSEEGAVGGTPTGSVAVTLLIVTKLVLLMLLAVRMEIGDWLTLALIFAWARLAMLVWVNAAARAGEGEAAALWPADRTMAVRWVIGLLIVSLVWDFALLAAPLALTVWQTLLRRRYGNSLLGVAAGIEIVETVTLAAVIMHSMLSPLGME